MSTHTIKTARWGKTWVFKEGESWWWGNEIKKGKDGQVEVEGS